MTKRRPALFIVGAVLLLAAIGRAQNNDSDTPKLIVALQLGEGDIVAEIGAGGGELTIAMAKHVGPAGKVYTSELGADRIQRLRNVAEKSGLSNIVVVEGQEKIANLPDECCDAVFMRNVYHHFGDPSSINASFLRALKPGGRIAVIDFAPPSTTGAPGQRGEDGRHGVSSDTVAGELKAVGFEIVSPDAPSSAPPLPRGSRERWFIVVAAKPQELIVNRDPARRATGCTVGWAHNHHFSELGKILATAATAPAIFLSATRRLSSALASTRRAEAKPTDSGVARGRSSRARVVIEVTHEANTRETITPRVMSFG